MSECAAGTYRNTSYGMITSCIEVSEGCYNSVGQCSPVWGVLLAAETNHCLVDCSCARLASRFILETGYGLGGNMAISWQVLYLYCYRRHTLRSLFQVVPQAWHFVHLYIHAQVIQECCRGSRRRKHMLSCSKQINRTTHAQYDSSISIDAPKLDFPPSSTSTSPTIAVSKGVLPRANQRSRSGRLCLVSRQHLPKHDGGNCRNGLYQMSQRFLRGAEGYGGVQLHHGKKLFV